MKFSILYLTLIFSLPVLAAVGIDYAGHKSNEARLSFSYFVDISSPTEPTPEDSELMILKQATHLFGSLGNMDPVASPKMEQQIHITKTVQLEAFQYRVYYNYQGKIVINQTQKKEIQFALPRDPTTIYNRACTDNHYWQEQYFWYFWNPQYPTCPLKEGQDYDLVNGELEHISNTRETYPDYERLFADEKIQIDIFMGMDNESLSRDPFVSKDIAAVNYKNLYRQLLQMGFAVKSKNSGPDAHIEYLAKNTARGEMQILFFFGPTSLRGQTFHRLFKQSLEGSRVVIYDGHSGLGEYLDLQKIENSLGDKVNFSKDLYQIYYMNGCSTYPYYNNQYFARKGGSANLEIITNGLATLFSAINQSTYALVEMIHDWAVYDAKTSYQDFVKAADSDNLIGVNGDEDESQQ